MFHCLSGQWKMRRGTESKMKWKEFSKMLEGTWSWVGALLLPLLRCTAFKTELPLSRPQWAHLPVKFNDTSQGCRQDEMLCNACVLRYAFSSSDFWVTVGCHCVWWGPDSQAGLGIALVFPEEHTCTGAFVSNVDFTGDCAGAMKRSFTYHPPQQMT